MGFRVVRCRSVIILVINKLDSRFAVVQFRNHSYDYRRNRTPLSPITIINPDIRLLNTKLLLSESLQDVPGYSRRPSAVTLVQTLPDWKRLGDPAAVLAGSWRDEEHVQRRQGAPGESFHNRAQVLREHQRPSRSENIWVSRQLTWRLSMTRWGGCESSEALSLLRVINVKIPLQPHQKYDITQ